MNEELFLVNEKGEVLDTLTSGDRILRNNSIKYLQERVDINFRFAKINLKAIGHLGEDAQYVMKLLSNISYDEGIIKYKNGKKINTKGKLGLTLTSNEKVGYRIVNRLIKRGIIHRNRTRENGVFFTFNPFIAHCGKKVPKALYNDFFDTEWRKYTDEL